MKTLLTNAKIFCGDNVVRSGDLLIDAARIAAIFTFADSREEQEQKTQGATRVDCSNCLIMPGLVNCHGHTPMTLLRGLGSGLPLQRWLNEAIFPIEAKMTADDIRAGMTWGIMEMLSSGITCVGDMYDFPEAAEEVARSSGFKVNLCRVGLAFPDGSPASRLQECIDYIENSSSDDRVKRDFCIHSEYLTTPSFVRALADANKTFKRPVHAHVSETALEHNECISKYGKTPIKYLADLGLFDFGAYAAHCVYCTDDDFRLMAQYNVTLVHNPTSNMKLGSGVARIARAKELGVNVALGTDGCASNDNLDMFEEMHLASLIAKGFSKDPTVLSATEIIEMASANGARALSRCDTGRIEVGKRADLCVVSLAKPHLTPCLNEANLIVNSMHSSDVVLTFVDGELLFDARDGNAQYLTINSERAAFDFKCALRRLGL